jgi:hypothetical protein
MNSHNEQMLSDLSKLTMQHLLVVQNELLILDKKILSQPRTDGGWSISECIDHLNTYFQHYLPLIELASQHNRNGVDSRDFHSSWLGKYFVKMMDPKMGNKKYKAIKRHLPNKLSDPYDKLNRFIGYQQRFLLVIDNCKYSDLNAAKISTSISRFIRLSLGDTIHFLAVHNERHIKQALNTLSCMPNLCT